jgi:hypothetical protein
MGIDYSKGAAALAAAPAPEQLKRIQALCQQERQLKKKVEAAEAALAEATKNYKRMTEDLLPNMIKEAGFTEVRLEGGWIVKVDDDIRANITEVNRPAAHAWLRAHGFGSVVKNNITVSFGMGEDKLAVKLYKELAKKYEGVKIDERVHSSTLRSLVTDILAGNKKEKGKPLALPESISYVSLPVANVKEPKAYESRNKNPDPF